MESLKCVIIFIFLAVNTESKKIDPCDFANEVAKYGMPGNLSDWVCIADIESGLDTNFYEHPVGQMYNFYGILKISDYYCRESSYGKTHYCSDVYCNELRGANAIQKSLQCANNLYKKYPDFTFWTFFESTCRDNFHLEC